MIFVYSFPVPKEYRLFHFGPVAPRRIDPKKRADDAVNKFLEIKQHQQLRAVS